MADEDNYNDEFSEGEETDSPNRHPVADEQYAQKVQGQIEALQIQLEQTRRELQIEKSAHEQTKVSLQIKEEELVKISVVSERPTTQSASTSLKLATEFLKFCSKYSISTDAVEEESVTDADIIAVLKSTGKLISSLKTAQSPVTGSESELALRVKNLEYELRLALGAAEDIKALKAKILNMVERIRVEKDGRNRAEMEVRQFKKKIEILGDHIEKLMSNLKYEATAKMRTVEALRTSERYVVKLKEKCDTINKKCQAKDRLIVELREGSKILEDQLRLMDEKYLELRGKLDWARENGMKKIKQAEKAAANLRMKFIMSGVGGSLDSIVLPDIGGGGLSTYSGVSGEMDQMSFESRGSSRMVSSRMTSSHRSLASKMSSRSTRSVGSLESDLGSEVSLEAVQDKLRKKQGLQTEWTEEKVRNLTKTR